MPALCVPVVEGCGLVFHKVLNIALVGALLAGFGPQAAYAKQSGRWSVTINPRTDDGEPLRCMLNSPADDGNRFRLTNSFLPELQDNAQYRGSAVMTVSLTDASALPEDLESLPGQWVRIPDRKDWTTDVAIKRNKKAATLTFELDKYVDEVLAPIGRGSYLEIRLKLPDNDTIVQIKISLNGSWDAVLAYEKCLSL